MLSTVRDLGVLLFSDITFDAYIDAINSIALRTISFINQNGSEIKNINCLKVLYYSLVNSIWDFTSVVWKPKQNYLTNELVKVQRRFSWMIAYKSGWMNISLDILAI